MISDPAAPERAGEPTVSVRILYHHRTLGDGAEGIHIREIIAALRQLGHEVQVSALIGDGAGAGSPSSGQAAWRTVRKLIPAAVYELAELAYNPLSWWQVSRAIQEFRPDCLYERYNTYTDGALKAARRAGVPVLLEVNAPVAYERSRYDEVPLKFQRLAASYESKICGLADRIFVVSTPLQKFLIDERGVATEKIIVLPNGANPDSFDPAVDSSGVKQRYGLSDELVIGFVGILRTWHGVELLLEAFASLQSRVKRRCRLLIVGDGPMEASLQERASSLGLGDSAIFTGRIGHDEMPAHVAAMDVAVSPRTTFYASPMKILEYMAMGVPPVAPRMQNVEDIVSDGVDGLLFEEESSPSLERALLSLVEDDDLRERLGRQARETVVKRLNWLSNAGRIAAEASALAAAHRQSS